MITFYRIEGQRAIPYNGDAPFINWIGRFSTGLIRYGRLIFELDDYEKELLEVKLPNQLTTDPNMPGCLIDDWTFGIYDYQPIMSPMELDPNDHDFGDGSNHWDNLMDQVHAIKYIQPQEVNGHKLYSVIIVCRSSVEGEFIDDLIINGQVYKIGCEFWGENESLKIELANKGIEFTDLIRKAIYSNDIHEDNPDWILLNRKYRELAMNFLDIYGNKGSYKSLLNSLKWFEYLDLAELREVWKYETPAGTKYFDQPVQQLLSKECERQMFNSAKTTYFALRSLKNQPTGDITDQLPRFQETLYNIDPDEIQSSGLACMWSEEEMRLKMALLGAFYEHYFMPIHLNLIRSSIEEYSAHLIHMLHSSEDAWIDECTSEGQNNFELDWDSDQKDEEDPDDPGTGGSKSRLNLHLDEVHVVSGNSMGQPYDDIFQNTVAVRSNEPYIPIVACYINDPNSKSSDKKPITGPDDLLKRVSMQHYNGIGATATGHFEFDEGIIGGTCETNAHGDTIRTSFSADGSQSKFDVTFLFPRPGDFMMALKFYGKSGRTFTKRVDVHVEDNISVDVNIRKLVAAYKYGDELPDPFTTVTTLAMDNEVPVDTNPRLWFARTREQHTVPTSGDMWYDLASGFDHVQYIPLQRQISSSNAPYKTDVYTIIWRGAMTDIKTLMEDFLNASGIADNTWYRWGTDDEDNPSYAWIQYISRRRENVVNVKTDINCALNAYKAEEFKRQVFFPEFHKLEDPGTNDLPNIYPIVCQPIININLGRGEVKTVPYSMHIDAADTAWEFFSWQKHQNIANIPTSTCDPFIGWSTTKPIPTGYYTVNFKYRFGDEIKTVSRVTPFKIVEPK